MFFKNAVFFRFPKSVSESMRSLAEGEDLQTALAEAVLKPVGPMELVSHGFIAPMGSKAEALFHRIGDAIWISVGSETRILPAAVINRELEAKLDEFEEKNGRRPGGKMRRTLKEDLIQTLLPRTLVKPGRTDAYLDLARNFIAVDTGSSKAAANVVSVLRSALGSFPALPLNAEVAPRAVMTGWIAGDPTPVELSLGDEAVMEDAAGGAKVRYTNQELVGEEIDQHLEAGKQVSRIGLSFQDHVQLVFGDDLILRKIKLLDGAVEQLESVEREDLRAELDARFGLMAGEIGQVFDVLSGAFAFSAAD